MKHLIVFTTKYGSVEKAAGILAAKLGGETTIIDLAKNPSPSLAGYDTISLGGSVYMGKVQKKLAAFVEANKKELLGKKIGLFVCAGEDNPEKAVVQFEKCWPADLFSHAAAKEMFGSEIYWEKVSLFEKIAMRIIKGRKGSFFDLHEDKIQSYAQKLVK